ncbi:DotU family type IV/VI secretion system protein [Robbsia sp. KACC 23696]|uniref:DotU family type IV/VI secretion system protein n=1 Tax=Robbsia sp. KACC 23696 TaxID=3149231 RepID=UPI00325AAF04
MLSIPSWQDAAVFVPFRAFVAEIDGIARSVDAASFVADSTAWVPGSDMYGPPAPRAEDGPTAPPTRAVEAAREVSDRLVQRLQLQGVQWQMSAYAEIGEAAHELQYMFAALADDLLLNTAWPGQAAWIGCLIEARLFNSHVAGDAVFARIERLVKTQRPSTPMLARLYLSMLALGYRGRYHGHLASLGQFAPLGEASVGASAAEQLARYRRALYEALMQRPLSDDARRPRRVDARPYAHTLDTVMPMRFRRPARWAIVVLIGIGVMLVLSELAWLASSWPVRETLRQTMLPSTQVLTKPPRVVRIASHAAHRDASA